MDTLEQLGAALGLAALCGINLYLTVFAAGLAIQQNWITLSPQFADLAVLGHPAIVLIAGILYFIEFFADKVPWVDSMWDTIHTAIRPIGGVLLALRAIGDYGPVLEIVVILVAGGCSLLTHGVKAGTRLVANASPEPFSNIALSLGEDVLVLGGLSLIHFDPRLALVAVFLGIGAIVYLLPRILRGIKARLFLVWRKLNYPATEGEVAELPATLPPDHDVMFHHLSLLAEKVVWAVPCLSGKARQIPGNLFGYLIATREEPRKLHFIAKKGWRWIAQTLELDGYKVAHEPKFLSENVVLYTVEKGPKYVFLFDRTRGPVARAVAAALRTRLAGASPASSPSPVSSPTPAFAPEPAAPAPVEPALVPPERPLPRLERLDPPES